MTGNEVLSYLLAVLAGSATLIFYIALIKPRQDEKKESQGKSQADIVPPEPDQYADIIDDYPTYNRQVK